MSYVWPEMPSRKWLKTSFWKTTCIVYLFCEYNFTSSPHYMFFKITYYNMNLIMIICWHYNWLSTGLPAIPSYWEVVELHYKFRVFDTEVCCQHCARARTLDNTNNLFMDHRGRERENKPQPFRNSNLDLWSTRYTFYPHNNK